MDAKNSRLPSRSGSAGRRRGCSCRAARDRERLVALDSDESRDYHGENPDGSQMPILNVFRRDGERIRHFWGEELLYAPCDPGQDSRHNDLNDPLWNLFDWTPDGRGTDWYPELNYS